MLMRIISAMAIAAWVFGLAGTTSAAGPEFSNTFLLATGNGGIATTPNFDSTGNSEPGIAFGNDGTMVIEGLSWLTFQVNVWKSTFGGAPNYFGPAFTDLAQPGRFALGGGDADVDVASTGTTHLVDLDFLVNRPFNNAQLGVSVLNCPSTANAPTACSRRVLDIAGADRPWITSDGRNVWVSYHDAGHSALIHVQRSLDDGGTWANLRSPIPGQGKATGDATFNNQLGPIVADSYTHNVYEIYTAGEPGIQKGSSAAYNNVFVSRSTDGGKSWTAQLVFHAPLFTNLSNIFPSLAVDPTDGLLHATWSNRDGIWYSKSADQGTTWSPALKVSTTATAVMPWAASRHGKVDIVYYGTSAASNEDPGAVWFTYDSQYKNGKWSVLTVSNTPNHRGPVCLNGSACRSDRELLDLFEVAEDPVTGKAAVVYTDSTVDTYFSPFLNTFVKLPEVVLAKEN